MPFERYVASESDFHNTTSRFFTPKLMTMASAGAIRSLAGWDDIAQKEHGTAWVGKALAKWLIVRHGVADVTT